MPPILIDDDEGLSLPQAMLNNSYKLMVHGLRRMMLVCVFENSKWAFPISLKIIKMNYCYNENFMNSEFAFSSHLHNSANTKLFPHFPHGKYSVWESGCFYSTELNHTHVHKSEFKQKILFPMVFPPLPAPTVFYVSAFFQTFPKQ